MRKKLVLVALTIMLALLTVTPVSAGSCKDFGFAWADFGQSGLAGEVVSYLASNGYSDTFPVEDGPGVLARIVHFEMDTIYPCD